MGRVYDGGRRTAITNNPNRKLAFENPAAAIDLLDEAWQQIERLLDLVWERLTKAITGVAGGLGQIAEWAKSIPILGDIVEALTGVVGGGLRDLGDWVQKLLTGESALDAGKLVGELPGHILDALRRLFGNIGDLLLGKISIAQLFNPKAGEEPNELKNGSFDGDVSLESDEWEHDPTVGRTKPGSARTTGNGNRRQLLSNTIAVAEGQKLDVDGWARWSGVSRSAAGPAFTIELLLFRDGAETGTVKIGSIDSPGANAGWTHIQGATWTVPADVDTVIVAIAVEATVTGGTVWFDDLRAVKVSDGMPQSWVTDLIPNLQGLWDGVEALVNRLLGALGVPAIGTIVDKILDLGDEVGEWFLGTETTAGALTNLQGFVQNLLDAILRGIRKVPVVGGTIADVIAELTGLNDKAIEAKADAENAQTTSLAVASAAVTTLTVNPQGTVTRTVYGPGNHTWSRPAPSAGKKITKFGVHVIGAGQGGGKAEKGNGQGAKDGLDGGSFYLEVLPADMPATLSLAVANGGAGATSTGPGAMPGPTRAMNGSTVFAEATMGAGFAQLIGAVPLRLETKPGRGGRGGDALLKDVKTDSNGAVTSLSYSRGDGENGESCAGGIGGDGGRSSGGWLGGSTTNAQAGPAARTDPVYRFGAPGGGGGYAGPNSASTSGAGAAGGSPGGGGGGGGGSPYTGFGGGTGSGGNGGNGEITLYVFEEPAA